jgi:hypothetical protein
MQIEALQRRCLLSATGYTIDVSDPSGVGTAITDEVKRLIPYSGNLWADHIGGTGASLLVRVLFDNLVATATGSSPVNTQVRTLNGIKVYEQGATNKLRTGIDGNGAEPDVEIHINPAYAKTLWFDPSPETRGTASAQTVPAGKVDAVSVLAHEFGHAFVFNGLRADATAALIKADEESTFDYNVGVLSGGHAYFNGANAQAAYGGRSVPLTYKGTTTGDLYHLGNAPPGDGSDLMTGLMNSVGFDTGTRYFVDNQLLAVLQDTLVAGTPDPVITDKLPTTITFTGTKVYTNAYKQKVTLKIQGAGKGVLVFPDTVGGNAGSAGNPQDPISLTLTGTNAKTTVFTVTPNANFIVGSVSAGAAVKSFSATTMAANTITLAGAGSIALGNVGGTSITIGSAGGKLTFVAKSLTDAALSLPDVATLTVGNWLTTDPNGRPSTMNSAAAIKVTSNFSTSLTIKKDLGAASVSQGVNGLNLSVGKSIGSLTVGRNLAGSSISAANILGINVKGGISTTQIRATSLIRKVQAGSLTNSKIAVAFVGALPVKLPTGQKLTETFSSSKATLSGVSVKGSVISSLLMAPKMSDITLGSVTAKNGGSLFGLLADTFTNISGKSSTKGPFSVGSAVTGAVFTDKDFTVTAL